MATCTRAARLPSACRWKPTSMVDPSVRSSSPAVERAATSSGPPTSQRSDRSASSALPGSAPRPGRRRRAVRGRRLPRALSTAGRSIDRWCRSRLCRATGWRPRSTASSTWRALPPTTVGSRSTDRRSWPRCRSSPGSPRNPTSTAGAGSSTTGCLPMARSARSTERSAARRPASTSAACRRPCRSR